MINRFFKLLYIFSLIAIALSLPVYLVSRIRLDQLTTTSYRAICLENNKYVVLQGSLSDEAFIFKDPAPEDQKDFNFSLNLYCKYYNGIKLHIIAFRESKTRSEQVAANLAFVNFENSVKSNISSYPKLYRIETVDKKIYYDEIYIPLIIWFEGALLAFIILQTLRISYIYVVFGKIVWHPFKSSDNN